VSETPLRLALVGCGNIAARHAAALHGVRETALACVSDIDTARAVAFASAHQPLRAATADEIERRSDIDAVLLCVPAERHADLGLRFVESGKHVLSEKPIDLDPARARTLIRAAEGRGITLSVVSQHRFHPDVLWLRHLLRSGLLGRPLLIDAFSLWSRNQDYYDAAPGRGRHHRSEGGVVLNQAVHCLDLMLWLFGPAASVASQEGTLTHRIAVEDTAALSLSFASGALGTLVASTSGLHEAERLEVRCERGTAVLSAGIATRCEWSRDLEIPPPPSRTQSLPAAADPLEPFRRQHRDFARAIAARTSPTVRGAEALAVLELALAAYESARTGERVKLGGSCP
jgi:predicted dehydrogenase